MLGKEYIGMTGLQYRWVMLKIISMIEKHETFTSFYFLKRQHCL